MKFLLLFILVGCNPANPTIGGIRDRTADLRTDEFCYRGFVYAKFIQAAIPAMNKYGAPLRCPKDSEGVR